MGPLGKVALVGAGIAVAGITFWAFSGNMLPWHHKEAPPQAAEVAVNGTHTRLDPAPVVRAEEPLPPVARPAASLPFAAQEDPRLKAYASPINAYKPNGAAATNGAGTAGAAQHTPSGEMGAPDALEASLVPTKMDGTRVAELPNPRWLIEAGRLLPCVQITKINSTLPGAVTATLEQDIRGETGDVIVLGKGARVFGTVQHGLQYGAEVLAVLWQHVTTPVLYDDRGMPHQFRIAVNSPASSELGETGLDGELYRHTGKKLLGITIVTAANVLSQGASSALSNAMQSGGGRNNNNTSLNFNSFGNAGNSAADELAKQWIEIPDVLIRNQGKTCSIYVVRDLDMRGAYTLQQQYRSVRG